MVVLHYPFTEAQVRPLQAGESVNDHRSLYHRSRPVSQIPLRGGGIAGGPAGRAIYTGDRCVGRGGGACDWLRADDLHREDPYMPEIIARYGVRISWAKAGWGSDTAEACRRHGWCICRRLAGRRSPWRNDPPRCVGALLAEFGATEAVWSFDVERLDAVVAIDTHGAVCTTK